MKINASALSLIAEIRNRLSVQGQLSKLQLINATECRGAGKIDGPPTRRGREGALSGPGGLRNCVHSMKHTGPRRGEPDRGVLQGRP